MSRVKFLKRDIEQDNEKGLVECLRFEYLPTPKLYAVFVVFKDGTVSPMWTTGTPHIKKRFKRLTTLPEFVTGMGIKRFEVVYPETISSRSDFK